MSVKIIVHSQNQLELKRAYIFFKIVGLLIIAITILTVLTIMLVHPEKMGQSLAAKSLSATIMLLLSAFLIREFYFFFIDQNRTILIKGNEFTLNNKTFPLTEIHSFLLIEYNGVGIMSNGFNLYLTLKSGKKLPILIRVSEIDVKNVNEQLRSFFKIEKFEKRKWLIG